MYYPSNYWRIPNFEPRIIYQEATTNMEETQQYVDRCRGHGYSWYKVTRMGMSQIADPKKNSRITKSMVQSSNIKVSIWRGFWPASVFRSVTTVAELWSTKTRTAPITAHFVMALILLNLILLPSCTCRDRTPRPGIFTNGFNSVRSAYVRLL